MLLTVVIDLDLRNKFATNCLPLEEAGKQEIRSDQTFVDHYSIIFISLGKQATFGDATTGFPVIHGNSLVIWLVVASPNVGSFLRLNIHPCVLLFMT